VRRSAAPGRAADLLLDRGPELLPSRAVVITGFADATGVATELIQALLSRIGGVLLLDRPPDPADPRRDDTGAVFLDRLASHLGGLDRRVEEAPPEAPIVTGLEAPGVDASIRGVAHQLRSLLDDGVEPEAIGVVARDASYLATPVRRHFPRLGIPFSGGGATVAGGRVQRRARQLASLLEGGVDTPVELWLESDTELLLALRTLGVVRLSEVAGLGPESRFPNGVPLPIPAASDDGDGRRRRLPAERVAAARRAAASLVDALRRWPETADPASHAAACAAVLDALGWDDETPGAAEVRQAVAFAISQLAPSLRLTFDELRLVLRRELDRVGADALGGAGGGVQVLSAIEARGRTFEHLFVVGLDRGVFPRVVEDDPMLPDQARGHLAADVLPDTPVKARGLDEERYLFAQLLASAPHVALCWGSSADAASRAPSAFVERYRRERGLQVIATPDPARPVVGEDPLAPRPAVEHAVLAALTAASGRDRLQPFLELAVREGRALAAAEVGVGADQAASARLDVLAEVDPPLGTGGPGPWAGLVAAGDPGDLPWVTGLEGIATCPFQAFVRRRLGVEPMPDPRLGLPETRGPLVGELVHAVLQRIVDEATGSRRGLELWELLDADPVAVPWPSNEVLEEWISAAATRIVRRRGLAAWGLEPLLAAQTRQCLEVARAIDWRDGVAPQVLAAEVNGELTVPVHERPLRFRADRVDRGPDGLVLVDYKTGRPISKARKAETRRRHLVQQIGCGASLQPVAYALAAPGAPASGRCLFLTPDIRGAPEEAREVRVRDDDAEVIGVFEGAVAAVATVWVEGACFPRVAEPGKHDTPSHCQWCDVAEACRRDDSEFNRRVVAWIEGSGGGGSSRERAAVDLWWLGRARPGEDR